MGGGHEADSTQCGELLDMRGEGMGKLTDDSNISSEVPDYMIKLFTEKKMLRGQTEGLRREKRKRTKIGSCGI